MRLKYGFPIAALVAVLGFVNTSSAELFPFRPDYPMIAFDSIVSTT